MSAVLSQMIASKNYTELADGWSTPISSIIRDDFVLEDEYATAHITLDDAASHRTGLGVHDIAGQARVEGRIAKPRDVVRNMRNLRMVSEPRVKFLYNNFMFVTLSHVIESLTGKWLGDVLRERLWAPLGMDSTYFEVKDALEAPEHFADGYAWDSKKEEFARVEYMNVTEVSGAGGVISNVKDYAKWARCLVNRAAPLEEEVHADIRIPRSIMDPKPSKGVDVTLYGVGWMRTTFHGRVLYHHSGGMHAFGAEVFWLPEVKFAVVSFGNTAVTSNSAQEVVIYRLMADKLGIPEEERFDLDSVYVLCYAGCCFRLFLLTFMPRQRKALADCRKTREKAIEKLFPNVPAEPLPSTFDLEELAGVYYDAGYGTLDLRVDEDLEGSGGKVLVADRSNMTFAGAMIFEHITGDYWMTRTSLGGKSDYMIEYAAAKAVAGVDGKPRAWEVKMSPNAKEAGDGLVVWERVE